MANRQKISGLEIMSSETALIESRVRGACQEACKQIGSIPREISVYLYGSPGRREMIGGDGDADIFILEGQKSKDGVKFRELFTQKMDEFDYSKLDLPEWGTLSEAETFMKKSLVEGNQVFETRFVWGDSDSNLRLEEMKLQYNSPERAVKNFIFNRLYLNEYFTNKIRDGAPNIKYCPGGSRDLLFLSWYEDTVNLVNKSQKNFSCQPKCLVGARTAVENGVISSGEYSQFMDAVDYLTVFRTHILQVNKSTADRGLSFLDASTVERLGKLGYSSQEAVFVEFERNRSIIKNVVDKVYRGVVQLGATFNGSSWGRNMSRLLDPTLSEADLRCIDEDDSIITMGKLWKANSSGFKNYFSQLAQKNSSSDDWAIIGTIVDSRFCSPEILEKYGQGICREKGFGYLLRVIARNPNTPKDTLLSIANDSSLEERYTSIARAALLKGVEGTKNEL